MRTIEHYPGGPHKLLRIESEGCAVNVIVGLHDDTGARLTVVEVEARYPDQSAAQWEIEGPSVVVVRCRGGQVTAGGSPYAGEDVPAGQATVASRGGTGA